MIAKRPDIVARYKNYIQRLKVIIRVLIPVDEERIIVHPVDAIEAASLIIILEPPFVMTGKRIELGILLFGAFVVRDCSLVILICPVRVDSSLPDNGFHVT